MNQTNTNHQSDALYFLPLGGSGEIGMNFNLYGADGKWLIVDCGISFADDTLPGLDIIMPDPAWIAERRDDLVGIVVTHGHEDHIGAIQYLWPELRCPVYATPFAASVLRAKLADRGLRDQVPIVEVPISGTFEAGPFAVELITMTHSIPEPNALVIRTRHGAVLHTGDWKLDPDPVVGSVTDEQALTRLGRDGVVAMVCDSTNALETGMSGSEAEIRESFKTLFARFPKRIAVTCFSTNVARLDSVARAAMMNDRHVALVGRSLWRIDAAARANGYLKDIPPFVTEHDAGFLPREKTVLICTGSQGEPRSALSKLAVGDHPELDLEPGDVVIFSAREIPGNERAIGRLQNALVKRGIEVVTADDEFVHVSGHPARDELERLYNWVRPPVAIPVHGEQRHLHAHARLAEACQVHQTVVPENGAMIRLAPGPAEVVDHVHHGRLAVDGRRVVPFDYGAMRTRSRMMWNGAAVATVVLDSADAHLVTDPKVAVMGLIESDPDFTAEMQSVVDAVRQAIDDMPRARRFDDDEVRQVVRIAVRRRLNALRGKKPQTEVHLFRL